MSVIDRSSIPIIGRFTRRQLLAAAGGTWAVAATSGRALAQGTSGQAVKMIVPFTPGTTPDLCARLLGPKMQATMNRTFIVDNRAGASGLIGMDAVAKSPADGTTLMFSTSTGLTLPLMYAKVPFDVMAFSPITMIGYTNFALAVHPSVPAKNVQELKAYANAQPASLDYASPGKGTFQHLCMEEVAFTTGMKLNHVPYKGTGPAVADLLGGHVKAMILPLHLTMPLVADGKLAVLGSTRKERDAVFTSVTPLAESGVPGLDADAWYAVWGPAGMSKDLVASYGSAIRQALADPEVAATLGKQGITTRPGTPEDLQRVSQLEYAKWAKLVKDIKLPPE